ncbi:hypothetical protein Cgig2_025349 [Carnegiea gigantea]|uniref:Uncharacterized protein n=1 Tax=Carnegiea gigantea TaxID=171969 RepID=A0A9Q1GIV2_9CARY|nr:hypothetical protein Cgig2_025349 [Carnegiea gigantea]
MSTIADTITRQFSEQVKRAMEVAGSAKPVHEDEPSCRPEGMPSLHPVERSCEVARSDRSDRLLDGRQGGVQRWTPSPDPHEGKLQSQGHPILRRPPPMMAPPRPQNAQKCCEFHDQNGHTMTEFRELKKALYELADKGQIDWFLKRGPRFLWQEQTIAPPLPRDEECSTEVVATIAGGYEVNPAAMTRLPVRFGDKSKFKSLEVDFLVFDFPTAYNVIMGQPTLHRVKAVVAPYLLQLQFETDGGDIRELYAPASASKGLVASSSAASPSDKGGINSTSLGSRPSAAACSHLAEVDEGVRAALLIALLPSLDHISRGLLQLTLHVRLELVITPLVLGNESLQPPAL